MGLQLLLRPSGLTLACLLTPPKPPGSFRAPHSGLLPSLSCLNFAITSVTRALSEIPSVRNSLGGPSFPGPHERLNSERFSNLPKVTQPVRSTRILISILAQTTACRPTTLCSLASLGTQGQASWRQR